MLNIKTSTQSKTYCSGINSQSIFLLFNLKSLKIKTSCFRACLRVLHLALYKATTVESVTQAQFWKIGYLLLLAAKKIEILKPFNALHTWRKHRSCVFCRFRAKNVDFSVLEVNTCWIFLISSEFSILKVILAMLFLNARFWRPSRHYLLTFLIMRRKVNR